MQSPHGRFEAVGLQGERTFWGYVKLADTNMRLAISVDRNVVLAPLHRGTAQAIAIFALVASGITTLLWLCGNSLFANPLRELDRLLRATLDNMDQGLIVVDKDGRLPICNLRAIELLGLPPHLMLGHPTSEAVIAYQKECGEFENCTEEVQSSLLPHTFGEERGTYERERPNGMVIEVRTVPFKSGGVVRTYTDVTSRKAAERALEKQASTDGLTGLANRRNFDSALKHELSRARRTANSLALIMLDVDHFKALNDRYGHLEGDACLQRVASATRSVLKRPGDMAARYGGEEFAILLPNTDLNGAAAVAEEIRRAIAELKIEHRGSPLGTLTVSAGVAAAASQELIAASQLIDVADKALYGAKTRGRNCVIAADKSAGIKQETAA